jgi:hypothetical protein
MKSFIKRTFFGTQAGMRKIKYGAASGIEMDIDPETKLQRLLGLDEHEIQNEFTDFSKKSALYIDVGASDGYYGLIYKKYNPSGKVILIEADPKLAPEQKANMEKNGAGVNVDYLSLFVASHDDERHITINKIASEENASSIFIKIDVEGAELDVLQGAKVALDTYLCHILIETHSKQLEDECIAFLKGHGYNCQIIDNAWWRTIVPESRQIAHNRWLSAAKA